MLGRILKWAGRVAAALVLLAVIGGTFAYLYFLPAVSDRLTAAPARPPVLGAFAGDPPVTSAAEWTGRRAPLLREAFQREVYGRLPPPSQARVVAREPLAFEPLAGKATVEQWTVAVGPAADAPRFNMIVAVPREPGPHPLIVMQSFCGNRAAMGGMEAVDLLTPTPCGNGGGGVVAKLIDSLAIFGEHIAEPPWERIVDRGYAVATFYAGDVVPDEARGAAAAIARLDPETPAAERGGAVAAWAWLYSRAVDVLEADPRFDPARTTVWGHSRNGKSALVAAAFDPRIDAVIAHQSGKGGATLTRADAGESVREITDAYGFWFGRAYADWAGREAEIPVDQHQLIGLIAPRPVLLGNGRRDMWSDPQGALRAAQGANPVYALFGQRGLVQTGLETPSYEGRLAFFMRRGRHGVNGEDWDRFLEFLDAELPTSRPARAAESQRRP